MHRLGAAVVAALITFGIGGGDVSAQLRLADESDRAAFRAWFVLLADAQFERQTEDVNDCAALVRHAVREALRAHTPEWVRRSGLPFTPQFADVRSAPRAGEQGLPLFRISTDVTAQFAEFADAKTLINLNAKPLGRNARAARPGDLLYFRQTSQREPDHLMVFVGRSHFETEGDDWVVYHTGPGSQVVRQSGSQVVRQSGSQVVRSSGSQVVRSSGSEGEVRKVRLSTLMQHPAPRWRPRASNPNFIGVFRLAML